MEPSQVLNHPHAFIRFLRYNLNLLQVYENEQYYKLASSLVRILLVRARK